MLMTILTVMLQSNGWLILTETALMDLLRFEFNMEINLIEQADVNMYKNIVTTALIKWSGWYTFISRFFELKAIHDETVLNQVLSIYNRDLKSFIQNRINLADRSEMVNDDAVIDIDTDGTILFMDRTKSLKRKSMDSDATTSKVHCSSLPNNPDCPIPSTSTSYMPQQSTEMSYSVTDSLPVFATRDQNTIEFTVNDLPFSAIMNWGCFSLHMDLSALALKRETCHGQSETFVSSSLGVDPPQIRKPRLDIKTKRPPSHQESMSRCSVLHLLHSIMFNSEGTPHEDICRILLKFLTMDFMEALPSLDVPGMYVKLMMPQPYTRCLNEYQSSNESEDLFLHTHQMIYPRYVVEIINVDINPKSIVFANREFLSNVFVACDECKLKFQGINLLQNLRQHFLFAHMRHMNWQCPHCLNFYPMIMLSEGKWYHNCSKALRPGKQVEIKCQAGLNTTNY